MFAGVIVGFCLVCCSFKVCPLAFLKGSIAAWRVSKYSLELNHFRSEKWYNVIQDFLTWLPVRQFHFKCTMAMYVFFSWEMYLCFGTILISWTPYLEMSLQISNHWNAECTAVTTSNQHCPTAWCFKGSDLERWCLFFYSGIIIQKVIFEIDTPKREIVGYFLQ